MCFAIGICFIVFNALGFAGDSGGIQQKEHSGLESPETASKHEKESLLNEVKILQIPLKKSAWFTEYKV
jgi:hypothetical protein